MRRASAAERLAPASVAGVAGAGFPFRDVVVARTDDPRTDAAATLFAHALAERIPSVPVVRGDDEALRVPVVVVPQAVGIDLTGARSIVCGVKDRRDAPTVVAAGALADVLDLQLVLVHVWDQPVAAVPAPLALSAALSDTARLGNQAAMRELLGDVARRAARSAAGAACTRVAEGPVGETLCRVGGDEGAALIAVTASTHGPFASALRGSVTRHVARHADRPVLVCRIDPDSALALDADRP